MPRLPIIKSHKYKVWIDTKDMKKTILLRKYIIYGLLGICLEVFWTGFKSLLNTDYTMEGTTYIWMFFIYGFAVFLEPIHDRIREQNVILRGFIYMILIYIVEFITGWLLRIFIGVCPWNYIDSRSINGLITLTYAPLWFALGLFFEKVHDFLNSIHFISDKDT